MICEACFDNGYVNVVETRDGVEVGRRTDPCPAQCEQGRLYALRIYEIRFKNSGVPKHFQDCTFDTWRQMPKIQREKKQLAYAACRLFCEREDHRFSLGEAYGRLKMQNPMASDPIRNSIILYGPVGVGKTGLTASIANALVSTEAILYLRVQSVIKTLQGTYHRDYKGASYNTLIHQIETAPLLILDEMTVEIASDDRRESMEEIIRYRCGHNLPFVITTNHDSTTFGSRWKERITDVLLESAHWIPMAGESLRAKEQPLIAI